MKLSHQQERSGKMNAYELTTDDHHFVKVLDSLELHEEEYILADRPSRMSAPCRILKHSYNEHLKSPC